MIDLGVFKVGLGIVGGGEVLVGEFFYDIFLMYWIFVWFLSGILRLNVGLEGGGVRK